MLVFPQTIGKPGAAIKRRDHRPSVITGFHIIFGSTEQNTKGFAPISTILGRGKKAGKVKSRLFARVATHKAAGKRRVVTHRDTKGRTAPNQVLHELLVMVGK
jgi:hypothetical protein